MTTAIAAARTAAYASTAHIVVIASAARANAATVAIARRAAVVAEGLSASVFAALVAVVHSEVLVAMASGGCESATVVPRPAAVPVPRMASAIHGIEVRASEVEIIAVRIARVDAEVPIAATPVQRTIRSEEAHV